MKTRELVERWVVGVIKSLDAGRLLVEALRREESEDPFDGPGAAVLAIGKAARSMAAAERAWAVEQWGPVALERPTLIVSPWPTPAEKPPGRVDDSARPLTGVRHVAGDHPQPGGQSLRAGAAVRDFLEGGPPDQVHSNLRSARELIVLLSGGGSSLVCDPEQGFTLDDVRIVNRVMNSAGVGIDLVNRVRGLFDRLKSGGAARLAAQAGWSSVRQYILSDVPGYGPEVVASGPFIGRRESGSEVEALLQDMHMPNELRDLLDRVRPNLSPLPPTVVPIHTRVVADHREAARLAGTCVRDLIPGVNVEIPDAPPGVISAEQWGRWCVQAGLQRHPHQCVTSGEYPVRLPAGSRGRGGRCRHAALAAALQMAELPEQVVGIFFATDGVDGEQVAEGPTVAGAWVTPRTAARARSRGLRPEEALIRCDSGGFFDAYESACGTEDGGLIISGPTGTNLNDLGVML
jgi:hydroxypyruvate reductase